MWLEGRWTRIAVPLAWLYAEVVLGYTAALAAFVRPGPIVATLLLWQFALVSHLSISINYNPLRRSTDTTY